MWKYKDLLLCGYAIPTVVQSKLWCCWATKFLIFLFCSVLILFLGCVFPYNVLAFVLRSAFDFYWQPKKSHATSTFSCRFRFVFPQWARNYYAQRETCLFTPLHRLFPISQNIKTQNTTNSLTCTTILQRRHLSISPCRQRNSSVLRGSDRLDFYAIMLPSLHASRRIAFFRNICRRLDIMWQFIWGKLSSTFNSYETVA